MRQTGMTVTKQRNKCQYLIRPKKDKKTIKKKIQLLSGHACIGRS